MFGPTEHGPQILAHLQCAGVEPVQRHRLRHAGGKPDPTPNTTTGLYGPGSQFDKSTSLAGGIFSSGSAARRIFFQATFSF